MLVVKLYFIDCREIADICLPEKTPYSSLCHFLYGAGGRMEGPWHSIWADAYGKRMAVVSEQSFAEAFNSRRDPRQPLRIFLKEASTGHENLNFRFGYPCRREKRPEGCKWGDAAENDIRFEDSDSRAGQMYLMPKSLGHLFSSYRTREIDAIDREFPVSLLPKDPSLAELVNTIRRNLEMAIKSVCVASEAQPEMPNMVETELGKCVRESDCSGSIHEDTLHQPSDESLRPDSVLSQSSIVVIAPDAIDSCCIMMDKNELESTLSDVGSEDTFEVVDTPDDWDDIDWNFGETLLEN